MWPYRQFLFGFLANGHFPRVSSQSRLSANDKGDNQMKAGTVNRSPGIYLTAEGNPRRTSSRKPSNEGCATSHRPQLTSLASK